MGFRVTDLLHYPSVAQITLDVAALLRFRVKVKG